MMSIERLIIERRQLEREIEQQKEWFELQERIQCFLYNLDAMEEKVSELVQCEVWEQINTLQDSTILKLCETTIRIDELERLLKEKIRLIESIEEIVWNNQLRPV
jgi:hypothetical protein